MNPANLPNTPPSLNELLVGFVNRPVDAAAIAAEASALGEVEPHEVSVGFRVEPRLAWQEGTAALSNFDLSAIKINPPTEWSAIVVRHDGIAAQPFALANYPQRVRDLTMLLQAKDLSVFRSKRESKPVSTALRKWADKQVATGDKASQLLVAAIMRAAENYDDAAAALKNVESEIAVENEKAALLWQQGEWEKAAVIWDRMPDSTVVWFNRGMASLFLNQLPKARECLKKAVENLPETSGWHHLGSLYLALAEIRK